MDEQPRKSIRDRYGENYLRYELIISLVTVSILFLVVQTNDKYSSSYDAWTGEVRSTLYPLIATIAGTLLGFIITAVSVIVSFFQVKDTRLSRLEGRAVLDDIYGAYISAIYVLALTTVLSIFGMFVNEQILHWISFIILWSALIASLRIWRCLWTLKNLIQIIKKPRKGTDSQPRSNTDGSSSEMGPSSPQ